MDNQNSGAPLWERTRDKIEGDDSFAVFRTNHPLLARMVLAFFSRADGAMEAMYSRDVEAVRKCLSEMAELYTWLFNSSAPKVDNEIAETWADMVRLGLPMEKATNFLHGHLKRGQGKPVSNRFPILLAVERKLMNPRLSWMKLAITFCACGQSKHDYGCRERIRHQAVEFDEMRKRLGV